jgi:large subunit ribosomal protein L4
VAARNLRSAPDKPAPRSRAGSAESTPVAPVLDSTGKKSKDLTLEAAVFGVEIKPHLVHETVRAELNARRAGTHAAKTRGFVAGGRAKPWRQKGTGRARAGTIRAPQFTGGGVAFPPIPRSYEVKVNKKVRRAAMRAALSAHTGGGTLGVVPDDVFKGPSTRMAAELLGTWGNDLPLLVIAEDEQENVIKSFRNLPGVYVVSAAETEVAELVWARSVIATESALERLEGRAR